MDCVRLIELVQKYPELYDSSHHDYGKVHVKRRIWDEISRILNESAVECKTKWACLRSSYVRDIRLQDASSNTKSRRKKKKWYLADSISFLKDHVQQKSKIKIADEDPGSPKSPNEETQRGDSLHVCESTSANVSRLPTIECPTSPPAPLPVYGTPVTPDTSQPTNSGHSGILEDNELIFFRSLLPDMHQLSQRHLRKFKADVLQLLNTYLDEDESERFTSKSVKNHDE